MSSSKLKTINLIEFCNCLQMENTELCKKAHMLENKYGFSSTKDYRRKKPLVGKHVA